jgi:gliding motility-associated-like protein
MYLVPGFGLEIYKVSAAGMQEIVYTITGVAGEVWRIEFDELNNQVVIGKGFAFSGLGFTGAFYMAYLPPDLSSETEVEVIPPGTSVVEDMVFMEIDPDGTKIYALAAGNGGVASPDNNNDVVVSTLPGLTGGYSFPTYHGFNEVENANYSGYGGFFSPNTFQGIAVNATHVFTYDGNQLKKMDKITGAMVDSVITDDMPFTCSGIAVDPCGNLYLGTVDSLEIYTTALDYSGGFATPDVVIDVRVGNGKLYVCGEGFLGEYDLSSGSSDITVQATAGNCGSCSGTVIADTIACPGYVLDNFSWSPGGATTLTVNNLCAGWYTATAQFVNPLSNDTIVVVDSVEVASSGSGITVNEEFTNETCNGLDNGTITLEATTGVGPFTYDIGAASNGTGVFTNLAPGTYTISVTDDNGCDYNSSITVQPGVNLQADTQVINASCGAANGSITLIPLNGAAPYAFDIGTATNSTGIFNNLSQGAYSVTVTDDDGCEFNTTLNVSQSGNLALVVVAQNNPTCYGFTDGSVTVAATGGTAPVNYSWIPANPVPGAAFNNLGEGVYTVTATDASGCAVDSAIVIVQPDMLDLELVINDAPCNGEATGAAYVEAVLNAQGDPANVSFFWNPDPGNATGLGGDTSLNMPAGTYSLLVNDDFGCSEEFTFTINEPDALAFVEFGYTPAYCRMFPYQSGQGTVYAAATGGTPDYTYLWQNTGTGVTSNNTTWGGLNPGQYQVTVTDDNGCILMQSVTVDSLNPVADFGILSAQLDGANQGTAVVCVTFTNQSQYFVNPGNPNADTTFWWNLNEPDAPWIFSADFFETMDTCYEDGGEYEVCLVVMNLNGCQDTTCKTITVFDPLLFNPVNIFSPQGDGANDEFTFKHYAKGVKAFHCVIINRWGTTVGEITDINSGWDGKDKNGTPCSDGVYFYSYTGEAENGEPFEGQGTVQIIASGGN